MHFDLHAVERRERVGERIRAVRERARVDDDRLAAATRTVDGIDEITFVVRLHVLHVVSQLRGGLLRERDELGQRRRAVLLGLSLAQHV